MHSYWRDKIARWGRRCDVGLSLWITHKQRCLPPCDESTVNEVCWSTAACVRPLPCAVTRQASALTVSGWESFSTRPCDIGDVRHLSNVASHKRHVHIAHTKKMKTSNREQCRVVATPAGRLYASHLMNFRAPIPISFANWWWGT